MLAAFVNGHLELTCHTAADEVSLKQWAQPLRILLGGARFDACVCAYTVRPPLSDQLPRVSVEWQPRMARLDRPVVDDFGNLIHYVSNRR